MMMKFLGITENIYFLHVLIHYPSVDISYSSNCKISRGMNITKCQLEKSFPVGRILIRSFVSTSGKASVASMDFNWTHHERIPVLCIYSITQSRTALNISEISEFTEEEQILIRPFSVFCVEKVEEKIYSYDENRKIPEILLNELSSTTGLFHRIISNEFFIFFSSRTMENT